MGNLGTGHARRVRTTGNQSGMALVLSLVLVTVVAILSAGVVQLSSTTSRMEGQSVDQLRAFYLAEAGLAESFAAVRIGRSGEIGAEDAMASYGEGQVWVNAVETSDGRIWLQSTGLAGSGKATLGLVVRPTNPPLGFFSNEDLVLEEGVLVDGFDSTERPYEDEILLLNGLDPEEELSPLIWTPDDIVVITMSEDFDPLAPGGWYTETVTTVSTSGRIYEATTEGSEPSVTTSVWPDSTSTSAPDVLVSTGPALSVTNTDRGGMLGSNGSIEFSGSEPAMIYGSIVPGLESDVAEDSSLVVTESTQARSLPAELDAVNVPALPAQTSIHHSDLTPIVISAADGDYDFIEVAEDCELILRGPARLSIETLSLAPRATLTLDTRDGDVDLFITGEMSCSDESMLETTGERSSEVRIQGATNAFTGTGAELDLNATSSFYGTIYAPDSTVKIGQPFEVFGSVVAKRLEIEAGARLHYDSEAYNGHDALPTQEAWRILELPEGVRRLRRAGSAAGLDALSEAHRLEDVQLSIRYVDGSGAEQQFTGLESDFNWAGVASVSSVDRHVDYRVVNSTEERELLEQWARKVASKGGSPELADATPEDTTSGGAVDDEVGSTDGPTLDAAEAGPVNVDSEPVETGPGTDPEAAEPATAAPPISLNDTRRAVELAVFLGIRDIEISLPSGVSGRIVETATGGSFDVTDADGSLLYYGTIDDGGGVSILTP